MSALLVCPVCQEATAKPCEDVRTAAVVAVLLSDADRSFAAADRRNARRAADPEVAVLLLVGQVGWPAVLDAARSHDGSACDPAECADCVSKGR